MSPWVSNTANVFIAFGCGVIVYDSRDYLEPWMFVVAILAGLLAMALVYDARSRSEAGFDRPDDDSSGVA